MDDSEYASKPPDHQSGEARRDDFWANRLAFVSPQHFTEKNRSHWWTKWALRTEHGDLGRGCAKLVLALLAEHANDNGQCWPKIATLCAEAERDRKAVEAALRTLRSRGLVEITRRKASSLYQLTPYRDTPKVGVSESRDTPKVGASKVGVSDTPKVGVQKDPRKDTPRRQPRRSVSEISLESREGLSADAMAYKQATNGD